MPPKAPKMWRSAEVYYYDQNKDPLILDCVRPLLIRLAPQAKRSFFVQHWLRGPHVRMCFLTTEADFEAAVRPVIDNEVATYLNAHPSTTVVNERQLLATHERLAQQERESAALTPLQPDNSVRYGPYDRRIPILGSESAARLLEDFYHETNELTFTMLDHVRAGGSRLICALDLMLATAHVMWPDIRRGFVSFRSHAEGFIVQATDPASRRTFCADQYRAQSAALQDRLRAILATLDEDSGEVPFLAEWTAIAWRFRKRADELVSAGEIEFNAGDARGRQQTWDPQKLEHTHFHRALQNNSEFVAFMQEDTRFLGFRLLLNYVYLHLNRLGIRPFQRFILCYLAASTVEDYFGVSATDLVTG